MAVAMMGSGAGEVADRREPGTELPGLLDRLLSPATANILWGMRPISATDWLHALLVWLQRFLNNMGGPPSYVRTPRVEVREAGAAIPPAYEPLRCVQLTTSVANRLFDEYAAHRHGE